MLQLPQGLAFRCPLSPPGPGRVGLHPGKGRPQEPLPLPAASVAWTWPECWDPLGLSGICSQSAPARRRLHQVTEHEEQGTGVPETVPGGARSPPLVSSSVSPASPPSPLLMTDDSTSRAWTRSTVGGGSGCCPAAGGWAARAGGNPHVSVASDPPHIWAEPSCAGHFHTHRSVVSGRLAEWTPLCFIRGHSSHSPLWAVHSWGPGLSTRAPRRRPSSCQGHRAGVAHGPHACLHQRPWPPPTASS